MPITQISLHDGNRVLTRSEPEGFCIPRRAGPTTKGCLMSYQLSPDATYQAIELFLYVMSFFAAVLIFLYIASERPPDKTGKKEDKESE